MACSVCGGQKVFLGKLASMLCYRCRNCGVTSVKRSKVKYDVFGDRIREKKASYGEN